MKTTSTAAAGALALAALVSAQSRCAIECFQKVITEHPPLTCTEENMYLCFCKGQDLQNYFVDCAYDSCGTDVDGVIQFGVGLCAELGAPITVAPRPSTTAPAPVSSTPAAVVTTSEPAVVPTTTAAVETLITITSPAAEASESEAAEESTAASEPSPSSEDSYPVPSAAASSSSSAAVVPSASGNGTAAPTTTPVPAGAAFNGASGLVAAGVAVLAALF